MRFLIKLLMLPVGAIITILLFGLDQVAKLLSYVMGIFYLIIVICGLLAIINHQWNAITIFGVLIGISLLLFLGLGEAMVLLECWKNKIDAL